MAKQKKATLFYDPDGYDFEPEFFIQKDGSIDVKKAEKVPLSDAIGKVCQFWSDDSDDEDDRYDLKLIGFNSGEFIDADYDGWKNCTLDGKPVQGIEK